MLTVRTAAAIATASFSFLACAGTQPPPTMGLAGYVRDFKPTHPDFAPISGGLRVVAGLTTASLDSAGVPALALPGFRINTPWTDSAGRPMAPHIADLEVSGGGGGVRTVSAPVLVNQSFMDTWDPSDGPYSPATAGDPPTVKTGSSMPVVSVPTGLPVLGDVQYEHANGTCTVSSGYRCRTFSLANNYRLLIDGQVTIVAEESFHVHNHGRIVLLPGASLTVYALKECTIENNCRVNESAGDPRLFKLYAMGTSGCAIQRNASVYGTLCVPNGDLVVKNSAEFFGAVTAGGVSMQNRGALHVTPDTVCLDLNDKPGVAGAFDSGQITSPLSFAQWFQDRSGINIGKSLTLTLNWNAGGFYQFLTNDFRPIDGQLYSSPTFFGPNRDFTFEARVKFQSQPCTGQFFEIETNGEVWVFIDNFLVIDIGGMSFGYQRIDFDRLGLDPSEVHRLALFYAQRASAPAVLRLRTNVEMESVPTTYPPGSPHYD